MVRFIDLCDTFHLPVVNFVDNPGFLIGVEAEQPRHDPPRRARARRRLPGDACRGARSSCARVFGVAGAGHGAHHRAEPALRLALAREWGSLPIEGGVEAAYRRADRSRRRSGRAARASSKRSSSSLRSPFLTAEAFGIEEIIDPRDTRPLLVEWARRAYELLPSGLGPKARGMRP